MSTPVTKLNTHTHTHAVSEQRGVVSLHLCGEPRQPRFIFLPLPRVKSVRQKQTFMVVVVEEGAGRALRGLGVRIKTDVGAKNQRSRGPARRRDGLTIRAQRAHFTATSSKPMGFCALLRWGERGKGGL